MLFGAFLSRFKWSYIGAVHGTTNTVDEKNNIVPGSHRYGYWILEKRGDGKRRSTLIGNPGSSPFATKQKASVKAWVCGGPLPELEEDFRPGPNRGNLVVLHGGKDSA